MIPTITPQVMHGGGKYHNLLSIMTTTFTLPKEAAQFHDAFQRAGHGVEPTVTQPKGVNLWILKPVGSSRGRGICLVSTPEDVASASAEEPVVVQRYIASPLLVQGYKFDLRLYVAVTSFNPLEAFLCTEGFARFATLPFTLDPVQLGNKLVHLTNSSVQKARSDAMELPPFLRPQVLAGDGPLHGGSKCSLKRLQELLLQQVRNCLER